jgi:primosomal protein N' (replication factor Y)
MFAEIILPASPVGLFTYAVPPELESQVSSGCLVSVPFGKTRRCTGIVYRITPTAPSAYAGSIKSVEGVIASESLIRPGQWRLWEWIARYYFCSWGEVSRNVLPAVVRSKENPPVRPRKAKADPTPVELKALHVLNERQQEAYRQIGRCFLAKDVCLLHGVTASGKTEVYTHLMQDTLNAGRQVLYLLPEIALTTQITTRLRQFFGHRLGVFHSKISDRERVQVWNKLLSDDGYSVILGVRSSIFLPFRDLGLVIVDEEHEPSYKQQDPAPRYHARNAAIVLATQHRAKVLLGSATPSVESFYNAKNGKYGYVCLDKRFENAELPAVIPVDVKELRRKKIMKSIFSPLLTEEMKTTLEQGEQIILFQNRRGFAPSLICKICDWTPKCRSCDVSLTYHKTAGGLACHYCGRTYRLPRECPECGNGDWNSIGYGTEKVEEEIRTLFPSASVARLDTDTAKNRKSLERIIAEFESGSIQILIGTQMISKGLHFDKVRLVGILNADALMNFPDFRAHERAYQLMSQVAGRAGRRQTPGVVILQTAHPDHPLIRAVLQQDYETMYAMQLEERTLFHYPPLCRLVEITMKHRSETTVGAFAAQYAAALKIRLGDRVIGPDKPVVGKIQNRHIRKILLKVEIPASSNLLKEILEQTQRQVETQSGLRNILIQYNVDPV